MLRPQLIGNLLTNDSLVAQNGKVSQAGRSQHDVKKTESHSQPPVGAVIEEVSKCQNKVFLKLRTVRLRVSKSECQNQKGHCPQPCHLQKRVFPYYPLGFQAQGSQRDELVLGEVLSALDKGWTGEGPKGAGPTVLAQAGNFLGL